MGLVEFLLGQDVVDALTGAESTEDSKPTCSHCGSTRLSTMNDCKNVQRYHCHGCFSSTSDTAGTVWHRTGLPPEKRQAIEEAHKEGKSCRKAASEIGVDKDTVNRAYQKLDRAKPKHKNRFALFGFDEDE